MKIKNVYLYKITLNHEPIWGTRNYSGPGEGVLTIIETDEGFRGYGSVFHPIPDEFQNETLIFLKKLRSQLIGYDPCDIEGVHEILNLTVPKNKTGPRTPIDVACHDLIGKIKGKPIYQLLDATEPNKVPLALNIYINKRHETPEGMVKTVLDLMERYENNGLQRLSLHLEGNPIIDKRRILAVADVFQGQFTLDFGGSFKDPYIAVKFLNDIYNEIGDRVLLVEHPCNYKNLKALTHVTEQSKIPVFIHGPPKTIDEIEEIIDAQAVKGIGLHIYRMGGFYNCIKIGKLAKKNNFKLMGGCGGVDGIITTAGTHLTAGIEGMINVDISNDLLFPSLQLVSNDTMPVFTDGIRIPSNRPGLGIDLKGWVKHLTGEIIIEKQ
jgi:L-alanine-DL-glutamate epimerase-like enolase superfamily enzyme